MCLALLITLVLLIINCFNKDKFKTGFSNKDNLAIVIIHFGNQTYLENCIKYAKKYNDNVFLIGDNSNKYFELKYNITHIHKNELQFGEFHNCIKYYKHMSSQSYNFELICFQRIFYIYNLMLIKKITKVFHLDSDCKLLININNFDIFYNYDACYIIKDNLNANLDQGEKRASIHNAYLTKNFCESYINLYMDIYKNKSKFYLLSDKIKKHYYNGKFNNGGICDMTLYAILTNKKIYKDIRIYNLFKPIKDIYNNEYVFFNHLKDNTGEYKDEYKKKNNKVIIYDNKYVYSLIKRKKILVGAIHYQGDSKSFFK